MWITVRRAVLALSIIFVASSQADTFVWIGDGFTTNWNSFSTPSVLDPGGYENWELNSQTPQFLPGADDSVLIRDVHDSGIIDLNGNRRVSELRISTTQFFQMRDDTLTLDAGNITRSDTGGVEANHLISSNVTLGKAGVLNMNGTGFLRIGGVLTAPAGFSKTGPAELVLSNTGNQIGGPVLIQRGKLRISPFLSGYVIDHDIVFQPSPGLTAFLETTASMNVTGAIRSDGSAYFQADLNVASGTTLNVLGGVGAGRLSLTGNGTLRTTSVTSDELRVRSGTLQLDGTVGSGTELYLSGGAIRANTALQTAGTLRIEDELGIFDTGPHRVSFASIAPGPILAADQFLVKRGSGTLAGSSQNTFVNVKIESGVFETDTPSNFNRLILEGGTFRPLVSTPSGSRATMQMGPGDGAIETPNDLTLGVSLSGSHRLSKRGLGSLRLTGFADNFTGLLAVEHGNLTLDLQGKLGSSAVSVSPGARLTLGGPFQLKRQTAVLVDGELEIPNGAIIDYLLLNGAAQTTGSAALSLPPGSNVVVSDPGSTTAINNRILTNAFGDPGQTVSFHVIPTDARLDLLNGVSSLTLFRKTGRGTLGLYGDGEFFPGLQIEDGTVEVGSTQAVFSEGDYMANDGLLRLGGGRLKLMGNNIRLPGVQLLADGGTIDLNGNDARIDEFNISGPGTLTVTGGGVLTLKTANSLPGGLVIDNATLVPDNPFALAGGSRVTMKGGTIRTTSATTSLPGLDIIPMTAFDLNILELDGAQVTPNGNISGKGRLYVGGQGAINFFGFAQDNAHPGFALALGATLRIDRDGHLGLLPLSPEPAQLQINGGTVDTAGDFTIHANRGIQIGAVGATFAVAGGRTVAIDGPISSPPAFKVGGFTKTGAGTLLLNGNNTYVGTTVIQQGTLAIGQALATGRDEIIVQLATMFDASALPASGTASLSNSMINDGVVRGPSAPGSFRGLTITGDLSGHGDFAGNVTLAGGYSPGSSSDPTAQPLFDVLRFTQDSRVALQIAGPADLDQLTATTQITLDGTLDLQFINGFQPAPDDVITLMTIDGASGFIDGWFANLPPISTSLPDGEVQWDAPTVQIGDLRFLLDYYADSGRSVVLRDFHVIPEPTTASLLIFSGLGILSRRRRSRK